MIHLAINLFMFGLCSFFVIFLIYYAWSIYND